MKFDNIYLLCHTGGDGAHFLMYLLGKYTDGYGQQYFPEYHSSPNTKMNDYRYIDNVIFSTNGYGFEEIDESLRNDIPWQDNESLYKADFVQDDRVYIQQIHAKPTWCTSHTLGKNKAITIIASLHAHFYISQLDRVKQDDLMEEPLTEYLGIAGGDSSEKSTEAYPVLPDVDMFYLYYDELILNQNVKEFHALCDFLNVVVTVDDEVIRKDILEYHNNNLRVVQEHCNYQRTPELEAIFNKAHLDMVKNTKRKKDHLQWLSGPPRTY